jgi:signal transduction histidine kinase
VSDTGRRISQEDSERLFNGITQLDRQDVGSGLGLTTCERVIRLHRGQINVTSVVDRGSEFTVRIPIDVPDRASSGGSGTGVGFPGEVDT